MRTLMSVAATTAPSPGWYPDPSEPERHLRWWDGGGWTSYVTDVPQPDPEPELPHAFADIVADLAPADADLFDDALDDEPIEFSWSDPEDLFEVTVAEPSPTVEDARPAGFTFRARPVQEPVLRAVAELEIPSLPVYESPLNTISSPLTQRVQVPVRIEPPPQPARVVVEPTAPEPEPAATAAEPPSPAAAPARRRRGALTGTGAIAAVAATAALLTNVLSADHAKAPAKAPAAALSAADRDCLQLWNTTASASAAQLRVTLGQFSGALAHVGQVAPLSGTMMQPNSCALTVNDPGTGTRAIFIAGLKDEVGYIDATSYPRAKVYGWPKTTRDANVAIRSDGAIEGL